MKKIVVVVGARPQFIKLSPLVEELSGKVKLIIIHTGQHYDFEMSDIFFRQLNLPQVDYHLGIGSDSQAAQVGRIMIKLEEALLKESPDMVVVIGDTNSTLAGAVTAAKNNIPLAHIEAGLRSKNNMLPEQINRIVTDRLSNILCCPTKSSVANLKAEGIENGVFQTGDILYDLLARINTTEEFTQKFLRQYDLEQNKFILFTAHRAENVDKPGFLQGLAAGLKKIPHKVFWPIHPRTEKNLRELDLYEELANYPKVHISRPVGIVESIALVKSSLGVITDSGGLQREAAYFGKKAYILRDETEWLELAEYGIVKCIDGDLVNAGMEWDSVFVPASCFQKAARNIAGLLQN